MRKRRREPLRVHARDLDVLASPQDECRRLDLPEPLVDGPVPDRAQHRRIACDVHRAPRLLLLLEQRLVLLEVALREREDQIELEHQVVPSLLDRADQRMVDEAPELLRPDAAHRVRED